MLRTLFPRRPTQKPPLGTQIDRGHPLARGLVGAWLFNENAGNKVWDSASGNAGTLTNAPTWQPGPRGQDLKFITASDQYVNAGNPAVLQITQDITIATSYLLEATTGPYELVSKDKDTGGRAFTMDYTSGAGARFYINGGGGADIVIEGRAGVLGDDRQVTASYRTSDKAIDLYVDGKSVASATAATSGIPAATANVLFGRREYAGFTDPLTGRLRYVYIWNRRLSAAEVIALFLEPYAMFAPAPMTRLWWAGAAAANPTQFWVIQDDAA